MASIWTSACNVCSNVHCNFLQNFSTGDPGIFFAYISMTTRARDFKFAGAIVHNSSKVVVGNGGLNSKIFQRIMHGFLVDGHIYMHVRNHMHELIIFVLLLHSRS